MFSKFKYQLLFSLLFVSSTLIAQVELKNKVVDFGTLLPVESASVYIKNTTIGTISNTDGKFVLLVPEEHKSDTLIISSIGYKSFKTPVNEFDNTMEVFLEEDVATLDEVLLVAEARPKTGNDIVLKALKELPDNLPELPYVQKGFLRHKERNSKEFKWLIESAITVYDSSFQSHSGENLKINVDEVRKSYDLRNIDSLFTYASYLKNEKGIYNLKARNLRRDTIQTTSLVKAIKWNDDRINGLENLFKGKLNLVRNSNITKSLFDEDVLDKHLFSLDTVLVDNEREIYKIKINKGKEFIGLDTEGIYNEGFEANGWIYIYYDNYAIKQIEYELVAASKAQKSRSNTLFGTNVNHKLVISYADIEGKMYPKYFYYETPKLVNVGFKNSSRDTKEEEKKRYYKEERYYYTVQEVLFSEVILEEEKVQEELVNSKWDSDIFLPRPYNKAFWRSYNTLLESEEDEKLIQDLTKRSRLFKE